MEKNERLTKEMLLCIRPGRTAVYAFFCPSAIKSAKAYIYECTKVCRPQGVARWETKADWDNCTLAISAIAQKEEGQL